MIPAVINWNVTPGFEILGIELRWYGFLFAFSFIIGYMIMEKIFKWENVPVKELDRLAIYMIISTIAGARLGHCLFYQPEYYLMNPIEILNLRQGGLASHGAGIGILFALWLFARKRPKTSYLWVVDRIVIVVALSGFFIRLGNFFNSEIYGIEASVPWAVIFERIDNIPRHPVQLYESISYLAIFIFLFFRYVKEKAKIPEGYLTGMFLILVFGARFILEIWKTEQTDFMSGTLLSMGQILSIPFVLIGFYLLYYSKNKSIAGRSKN